MPIVISGYICFCVLHVCFSWNYCCFLHSSLPFVLLYYYISKLTYYLQGLFLCIYIYVTCMTSMCKLHSLSKVFWAGKNELSQQIWEP